MQGAPWGQGGGLTALRAGHSLALGEEWKEKSMVGGRKEGREEGKSQKKRRMNKCMLDGKEGEKGGGTKEGIEEGRKEGCMDTWIKRRERG